MKWNIENILINIQATLKEMKETFQAGVNTIYDAIVARDVTPASKSPADMAAAIAEISGSPLIPVIENGVIQEGFELKITGGGVIEEDENQLILSAVGASGSFYVEGLFNAAIGNFTIITSSFQTIKISTNTNYNANGNAPGIRQLSGAISYEAVAGTPSNFVICINTNGKLAIKSLYLLKEENNNG